jgi:protein SCO1/2
VRRKFIMLAAAVVAELATSRPVKALPATDISGALPPLDFMMRRSSDAREVSGKDYKGKAVILYFGYTQCADICPMTLANLTTILQRLGPLADQVRALFVTVDPNRDTLEILNQYMQSFAPQIEGLRGSSDQLAALAQRYRVAYSVQNKPYVVSHSVAAFLFGRDEQARYLLPDLGTPNADIDEIISRLRAVLAE